METKSVSAWLEEGVTIEELEDKGIVWQEFYGPSGSLEYYDGENYYNLSGQELRDPGDYELCDGYFGDE